MGVWCPWLLDCGIVTPVMLAEAVASPGPRHSAQPLKISREFYGCSQGPQDGEAPRTFQKSQTPP